MANLVETETSPLNFTGNMGDYLKVFGDHFLSPIFQNVISFLIFSFSLRKAKDKQTDFVVMGSKKLL